MSANVSAIGYAQPTALVYLPCGAAFKRLIGLSPGEYRAQLADRGVASPQAS